MPTLYPIAGWRFPDFYGQRIISKTLQETTNDSQLPWKGMIAVEPSAVKAISSGAMCDCTRKLGKPLDASSPKDVAKHTSKVSLGATKLLAQEVSLAVVDWVELNWVPVFKF